MQNHKQAQEADEMPKLIYKTRGNSSPQGKQKVYFCCHPDDFNRYFNEISEEILEKQNCSIWYLENYETEYDEQFFEDLKGMQLFVVPVTTNFVCKPNHACETEVNFANENNIPVLPLMQESGLEEIFNKKLKGLHFLDKNNNDITAISYDKKLEDYLNAVLIGDEVAEKIRAAFDAYVFLSYRKKDRKYAQELMRLIHKNDFCRDIAIWYDEFLMPGEDFNESIKKALTKSELFVLAVTPNLVNEKNYIMTTEYPMAQEVCKPILPAELVPTDKKQLAEKYEGIPMPVNVHDETKFSQLLFDVIKTIAIKETNKTPEHSFFIGLAYLQGVDVEVDYEKAVALITASAEAGVPEAMTKLVEMYRNGIGVKRSHRTAIEWQERLVEYYQKQCNENAVVENYDKLFWEIFYCGTYYARQGRKKKSISKYWEAKEIVNKALRIGASDDFKRYKYICYIQIGDYYKNDPDEEIKDYYYEPALEICLELDEKNNTEQTKKDLSICYSRIGRYYYDKEDTEKAIEYYKKALEVCHNIFEKTNTISSKRTLAENYMNIGDVYKMETDYEKSQVYYENAFNIYTAIVEETNKTNDRRNLAVTYFKIGRLYYAKKDFDKVIDYFGVALGIFVALDNELDTVESKKDLAFIYEKLGFLYNKKDDIIQAKEYYEKAIYVCDSFVDTYDFDMLESRKVLYRNCLMLKEIYKAEGNLEKVKEISEKMDKVFSP